MFAYLAHTLRLGAREIPYAVVAGVELDKLDPPAPARRPIRDDQIWLNAWAAEGLRAKVGDTVYARLRRLGRRRRDGVAAGRR